MRAASRMLQRGFNQGHAGALGGEANVGALVRDLAEGSFLRASVRDASPTRADAYCRL